MKRQRRIAWTLAALCLSVALVGCQPTKNDKLTVGKIDTAELLQDDPDYQSLSIDYVKENTAMRDKFVEQMKGAPDDASKKGVQEKYQEAQKVLDTKWMGKTQQFLESRHTEIRDIAQTIAKSKDIDIVIIDSKAYPTTEWGGVELTRDLQLALSQSGDKPAPTSTPENQGG